MTEKLDATQLHFLRLTRKGAVEDGWAPVSKIVWTLIDRIPAELLEREPLEGGGGRCRLTHEGNIVLDWT